MEKSGLVVVNKPTGITSHTAVSMIRRIFGVEKAGHTGTLDPMASGVLPVLIGRAVKAAEFLSESDKRYLATLTLGLTTDTEDATGTVLSECEQIPSRDAVFAALDAFRGPIRQTPPMYSAVKVGGRRLMDLARSGKTVERQSRAVTIRKLDAAQIDERNYQLDVICSKGTYIRTLCADIGRALGCGGIMSALVRTEAYGLGIDRALTPDEYAAVTDGERDAKIIPTEDLFPDADKLAPPAFFARLLKNGLAVETRKLGLPACEGGKRIRLYEGGVFFALAETREQTDGEGKPTTVLAPLRQFVI